MSVCTNESFHLCYVSLAIVSTNKVTHKNS